MPHKDTPKGETHIGTLLVGLPSAFTGGELILRHNGEEATIDWATGSATRSPEAETSLELPWVFFYSDVEHEILHVQSGHRLTLAYDIFGTDTISYQLALEQQASVNIKSSKCFRELQALLDNPTAFPGGASLAFSLAYQYPVVKEKTENEVHQELRSTKQHPVQHPGTRDQVIALLKGDSRLSPAFL